MNKKRVGFNFSGVLPVALMAGVLAGGVGSARPYDEAPSQPKAMVFPSEVVPAWGQVAQVGSTRTVYVSPDGLNGSFVAQVLGLVTRSVAQANGIEVLIFDDRQVTPRNLPMTNEQLLHLRARYRRDPKRGRETFAWVTIEDAETRPPKLRETEASVRPWQAG